MAALGLDHYNIRAPSPLLEALRDFYVATLGLRAGPRPRCRTHGYWLYAGEQAVLHLSGTRADEVREVGVTPTFDHVAFRCDDDAAMRATRAEPRALDVAAFEWARAAELDPAAGAAPAKDKK